MREYFDAAVGRSLERSADGLGSGPMAGNARKAALLRPAAVAVHDDCDVARDPGAPREPGRALLGAGAESLAEDFLFLGRRRLVDLVDRVVGQLLHFMSRGACARPR